jgi:hypothetical protein
VTAPMRNEGQINNEWTTFHVASNVVGSSLEKRAVFGDLGASDRADRACRPRGRPDRAMRAVVVTPSNSSTRAGSNHPLTRSTGRSCRTGPRTEWTNVTKALPRVSRGSPLCVSAPAHCPSMIWSRAPRGAYCGRAACNPAKSLREAVP